MTQEDSSDRMLLALGVLPLLVAGSWLVLLREPSPVAAHATRGVVAPRLEPIDERMLEAGRARFLGLVSAGQEADLGTELSGQIVRVWAEAGTRVRRGQPLVQLASSSMLGAAAMARAQRAEDRSAEQSAELSFEAAHDKAERMGRAANAYSDQELRAARLEARRAKAELDKLRANAAVQRAALRRELARSKNQVLSAPFDGVLANRFVDAGDFVAAGAVLARVVDDTRYVRFAVPARDMSGLQIGTELQIAMRDAATLWSASLVHLQPELDAASGLGFARAELDPSASTLVPGTRVDVLVVGGAPVGSP